MAQGSERNGAGGERGEARRAQILEAAAVVFGRQGYHGARMDDIVRQSGLSKGALYWYFKSKEELAVALVHQMLDAEAHGLDALVVGEAPAIERLETLARSFAREMSKAPERAPLALELLSLAQHIPEIKACYAGHHERYLEQMRGMLGQLAAPGEDTDRRVDAAALALAGVVDGLVMRWSLAPSGFDLEERLWDAVSAIVRGLPGRG